MSFARLKSPAILGFRRSKPTKRVFFPLIAYIEARLIEQKVFPSPEMEGDMATTSRLCLGDKKLIFVLKFLYVYVMVDFGFVKLAKLLVYLLTPIIQMKGN